MNFDYASLITDRAVSDSDTLKALLAKPLADWTEAERTAFNSAMLKGSYDYTDLNRVDACLEDLVGRLGRMGYAVPGYQRVKLPRSTQPASRLPEGYTEVQYIRSTGTQYVDTGVKPNQSTRVVVDTEFPAQAAAAWLFGARNGNTDRTYGFLTFENAYRSDYNTTTTEETISETPSGRFTLDKDGNVTKINGDTVKTAEEGTFQCTHALFLFANNNNGATGGQCSAKIYSSQIYSGGALARNYIPCYNPSWEAGLYDVVSGQFYGNAGTGVFIAGPPRVTLPEGYTQVEHIQSSGAQFIDSDFTPNQDTQIIYDCERLSAAAAEHFFGVRTGNAAKNAFCFYIYNSGWRYAYNNAVATGTGPAAGRYWIDADKNAATINGTVTLSGTYGAFAASATALLFAMRSTPSGLSYGSHKLFLSVIRADSANARIFIPCTNANGTAGLYDLVGQEFYGNAGTGSFTAGEAVTWPEEPEEPTEDLDPYTWYESDVPTVPLLAQYRGNVAAVRAVLQLPEGTPEPPVAMAQLTTAGANSIEAVLLAVDLILNHIPAAVRHCGVTVCGSKGVMA